jgi:hypothetical protein
MVRRHLFSGVHDAAIRSIERKLRIYEPVRTDDESKRLVCCIIIVMIVATEGTKYAVLPFCANPPFLCVTARHGRLD